MIACLYFAPTDYDYIYFTTTLVTPQRFQPPLIADGVGIPRHAGGLDIVAVAYYFGEGDEGGETKRNKNRAK